MNSDGLTLNWPPWWKIINKSFIPLINCRDRFLLLYGGRDSSKSSFAARYLIFRCITEDYFRYLLVRRFYAWVPNSQFQNLVDTIEDLGLTPLFRIRQSPAQITCVLNGNRFLGVGMDDVQRIKSIKDPTGVWWEEDILDIPYEDFVTVVTSIRSTKADFLQDVFTFNPEVSGQDYADNWFYKMFFEGHEGELSFRDSQELEIGGEIFERSFTVHHSNYKSNRWVPKERIAEYELIRERDPYYATIYVNGIWGNKDAEGLFYYGFSRDKNVYPVEYNANKPIHLTFDFNVRPYVSASVWQIIEPEERLPVTAWSRDVLGREEDPIVLAKVGEIAAKPPENRTKFACQIFAREYAEHRDAVFLYGDPAGKQEDTRSEVGANDFSIISQELRRFNPRKKLHQAAPNVAKRGEFINRILQGIDETYSIVIDPSCELSIVDYTSGKEDAQGRKLKEKAKDKATGITFEKYHHFTDGDDYFLTKLLSKEFSRYLRGGSSGSAASYGVGSGSWRAK